MSNFLTISCDMRPSRFTKINMSNAGIMLKMHSANLCPDILRINLTIILLQIEN